MLEALISSGWIINPPHLRFLLSICAGFLNSASCLNLAETLPKEITLDVASAATRIYKAPENVLPPASTVLFRTGFRRGLEKLTEL
jgi:hypothetical protein